MANGHLDLQTKHKSIVILGGAVGLGITLGLGLQSQLKLPDQFHNYVTAQSRRDSLQDIRIGSNEYKINTSLDSIYRLINSIKEGQCEMAATDLVSIRSCRGR